MNLYILWVNWEGKAREPEIFESEGEHPNDHQKYLTTTLDKHIALWKAHGATVDVTIIHGMAVEPLRKYFQK